MRRFAFAAVPLCFAVVLLVACRDAGQSTRDTTELVRDNPLRAIPTAPLGLSIDLSRLRDPPTPERVRLGRWLFFDKRLSADGSLACSSCHQPEFAFSQGTAVAMGIRGQRGRRKVPPIINLGVPPQPGNFRTTPRSFLFWDGRAASLEAQALQPIAATNEMGNNHPAMVATLSGIQGYGPYFAAAFGDAGVTQERIAHAIADYERTRMSGNSPFDRWRAALDDDTISKDAKLGFDLFSGKAQCAHSQPDLSVFVRPLHLTPHEVDALVAFLNSLEGEGWQDEGPRLFPR